MGPRVEPDGEGLRPILVRMFLSVVRIPQIVEVPDITLRPGVDPVEIAIAILLVKIPERFFPILSLPKFISVIHRMACFMTQDFYHLLIRRCIAFKVFQFGRGQIERDANGYLLIHASPLIPEIEVRP
jgi:hypothetical protein